MIFLFEDDNIDLDPALSDEEKISKATMLIHSTMKALEAGEVGTARQEWNKLTRTFTKDDFRSDAPPQIRQLLKWARDLNRKVDAASTSLSYNENLVIDLGILTGLQEFSVLSMLGGWIEILLGRMFGNSSLPVTIKGPKSKVDAFAKTIGAEKRYIEALRKHGLDNPAAIKSKSQLDKAIAAFEKETKLQWPYE